MRWLLALVLGEAAIAGPAWLFVGNPAQVEWPVFVYLLMGAWPPLVLLFWVLSLPASGSGGSGGGGDSGGGSDGGSLGLMFFSSGAGGDTNHGSSADHSSSTHHSSGADFSSGGSDFGGSGGGGDW